MTFNDAFFLSLLRPTVWLPKVALIMLSKSEKAFFPEAEVFCHSLQSLDMLWRRWSQKRNCENDQISKQFHQDLSTSIFWFKCSKFNYAIFSWSTWTISKMLVIAIELHNCITICKETIKNSGYSAKCKCRYLEMATSRSILKGSFFPKFRPAPISDNECERQLIPFSMQISRMQINWRKDNILYKGLYRSENKCFYK